MLLSGSQPYLAQSRKSQHKVPPGYCSAGANLPWYYTGRIRSLSVCCPLLSLKFSFVSTQRTMLARESRTRTSSLTNSTWNLQPTTPWPEALSRQNSNWYAHLLQLLLISSAFGSLRASLSRLFDGHRLEIRNGSDIGDVSEKGP